ncbi:hypothetical protein BC629DRAFT_1594407 [Irpex lacteus]|nr:hypothetical protein BC629DRAFT_1594407 [Irpex lacteus]
MAAVTNLTVSHLSPLISYVPGMLWSDGGKDSMKDKYQGKGYHSTNSSEGEGRLFFTWVGTDVWVYGGYRERLGPYRVTIDGKQYEHTGFNKSDPENPNAVLFNSKGLKFREHHMEIVNVGQDDTRPYGVFDISHIIFQHHGTNTSYIEASDPSCHWSNSPSQAWTKTQDSRTTYASSAHMNITFEVHLELRFRTGTGVMLYGAVGPNSSSLLVSVDGVPQTLHPNPQPNSSATEPQLLFVYEGMEPTQHTLVVRNNPALFLQEGAPTTLNIHHALVFESSQHPPPPPDPGHANLVIGIVISAVAFILLIALVFSIWLARRRLQKLKKFKPQPFNLRPPRPRPTSSILPYHLSAALARMKSGAQSHRYTSLRQESFASNVATQDTSPSQMQEQIDDFSPTTTLFIRSRRNTAVHLVTRKARQNSFSAAIQTVEAVEEPPVPDIPLLPPPPTAAGPPSRARTIGTWPSDSQVPSTSHAL